MNKNLTTTALSQAPTASPWPFISAIVSACILGSSAVFVRFTQTEAFTTGFYRLVFAVLTLGIIRQALKKSKLEIPTASKKDIWLSCIAGAFFALDLALWNWSLDFTTVANATLFNNFVAFFVPLLFWILYGKRPPLLFGVAVGISLFGTFLITGDQSNALVNSQLVGDTLAILSAITLSGYVLVVKNLRARMHTLDLMFWTSVSGVFITGLLCFISDEPFFPTTWKDWGFLIILGAGVHAGGQGLFAYAMGSLSAGLSCLILLLAPVVATVFGWFVFNETMGALELIGCGAVLASIVLARRAERG